MNQIIFTKHYSGKLINNTMSNKTSKNERNIDVKVSKTSKTIFVILLIISILVLTIVMISAIYSAYIEEKRNMDFYALNNNYSITKLYSNNTISNYLKSETSIFHIIGIIKIDKIKLSAPILSDINDDFLKIAPCRFSGPDVNEKGNLCIAGHNYNDNRFFSNISKLSIDDEIKLFNNNGEMLIYKVFEKYETDVNDITCTFPSGNNIIEITLITCNNFNGNRIIIKAKSMT